MNVALDNQPNCIVNLEIDLPADRVTTEWNKVAKAYQKQARIPGYRPGKAPMAMIESRYGREIESEVSDSLSYEAVVEAVKEKTSASMPSRKSPSRALPPTNP